MRAFSVKSIFIFFVASLCFCTSAKSFAAVCVVKNANVFTRGGLQEQVEKALDGDCASSDSIYRERYNKYYPGETRFHVITFQTDMQLTADHELAAIQNTLGEPLLLFTGDKNILFDGDEKLQSAFLLQGEKIILDGIRLQSFRANAIELSGAEHLVIRTSIKRNGKNGIVVKGNDHLLSQNEISSNALNGVVIESDEQYDCAGAAEKRKQNISLRGNTIHDNGTREETCTTSRVHTSAACAMLAAEGKYCAQIFARNCDDENDESCKQLRFRQDLCRQNLAQPNGDLSQHEATQVLFEQNPQAYSGSGVLVHADGVQFSAEKIQGELVLNHVANNKKAGIYVANAKPSLFCNADISPSIKNIRTVEIAGTGFSANGDIQQKSDDLIISHFPFPGVKSLVGSAERNDNTLVISGYVLLPSDPLEPFSSRHLSADELKVEVFSSSNAGKKIKSLGHVSVSPENGRFVLSVSSDEIPESLRAIVSSTYYQHSSELSQVSLLGMSIDTDGDGLNNDEEDKNGNGKIDVGEGETDPLNPDTDGDGLTDAEEVKMLGHVQAYVQSEEGRGLQHPRMLDPNNPDSDGDCLPDGLELGVTKEEVEFLARRAPVKKMLVLSPACFVQLQKMNVEMSNVIPFNVNADGETVVQSENIAFLYDENPTTLTDPTLADTDRDGLSDGEEDWDLNGAVSLHPETEKNRETDPLKADSDGDDILDGDEGDRNRNNELDERESNSLEADSDGDGVPDGIEEIAGTKLNDCDSDGDGLSDGVEMGYKSSGDFSSTCHGLSDGGTNYAFPQRLDPLNPDSDGDGIRDGEEDKNGNGWIEDDDSDPSSEDTDNDGIEDGVELRLDFNHDEYPDFELDSLVTEGACTPESAADIDCDTIPNYLDADSDNDGCPDKDEQLSDINNNDIPDVYDAQIKQCGASSGSSSSASASIGSVISKPAQGSSADKTNEASSKLNSFYIPQSSGGTCSLVVSDDASQRFNVVTFFLLFAFLPLGLIRFVCRK
ncbi:MAG: hypothetical protein COX62_01295 [Deltaproteobacteria bacterium CG_4_10_14_0_2_um_filter_43_8]|nr:MAG: hypothetical protein COV43_09430 [Deltaproteobacteria bacterium CG11_big_fil_rev_8_21_14_0_20_42_23]PJA21847.1 MAG: hypothetical protein COX62_01295 [Deltaproteobacteria bacterium CG_4_10_14_0_2_um_filter_43_8]PJC64357.1 MAG: hypothetical protein CO021_04975 [Deltaproteobacteria bacterium CG_4_9_14_0_2_um_filter_42_21]